jgi:hypothetical protein
VQQLRIQAIPLADDDGKGVIRANQALAHAGVELAFEPKWEWTPRDDTKLNRGAPG